MDRLLFRPAWAGLFRHTGHGARGTGHGASLLQGMDVRAVQRRVRTHIRPYIRVPVVRQVGPCVRGAPRRGPGGVQRAARL